MAKNFSELRSRMSVTNQEKSRKLTKQLAEEMPLRELRQAMGLSQKVMADILEVNQPAIAKLEKRTDMYISTLRSHIQAMGGELVLIANFPEGSVKINNFSSISGSKNVEDVPVAGTEYVFCSAGASTTGFMFATEHMANQMKAFYGINYTFSLKSKSKRNKEDLLYTPTHIAAG